MNNYEFYAIALTHIELFMVLLVVSIILHILIFRPIIYSIIDPLLLPAISNVFCFVVVYLLFFTNNTSPLTFISYNLTQLAFFIGLYTFRKIKFKKGGEENVDNAKDSHRYETIAFYFFSTVYLGCMSIIYLTKGIPLFMQSRLETFAEGGGEGILGRITDVSSIFALYAFFCIIKIDKLRFKEIPKYIILLLIFLTFFLSGGKGNFLTVISTFFCYLLFRRHKKASYYHYIIFLKKHSLKLLIFAGVFVLGIIVVQSNNATTPEEAQLNPVLMLALRFLHSGDIFWYAYPNNVYLVINGSHWFSALFTDTLGLFRIYQWEDLPQAIGIVLKNIHHPSDVPQGPNARHNIFGLIYYGFWGSIVFSYLIGAIIAFVRFKLLLFLKNNILSGFIFTYLFIKISALDTDPMLTMTYMNNLFFIFPILFVGFLSVLAIIDSNKQKHVNLY